MSEFKKNNVIISFTRETASTKVEGNSSQNGQSRIK